MSDESTRRSFILTTVSASVLAAAPRIVVAQEAGGATPGAAGSPAGPRFPRQDDASVRDTVGASHANLEKVRGLVESRPALANAAWDWGFGDWESALGAAAHTGHRAIAEYLLSRGARLDIFAAAMLGQLPAVKGMIEAAPGLQRTRGPHGITLLAHARAGGESAAAVAEYLTGLGDADLAEAPLKPSVEQQRAYLGTYAFGAGRDEQLLIALDRSQQMQIQRESNAVRMLLFVVGEHEFHPAGAAAVRIRFDTSGEPAKQLTILDGGLQIVATRVA